MVLNKGRSWTGSGRLLCNTLTELDPPLHPLLWEFWDRFSPCPLTLALLSVWGGPQKVNFPLSRQKGVFRRLCLEKGEALSRVVGD